MDTMREYRKGNWTIQETMVLIEAKKMDDERRMKKHVVMVGDSSSNNNKKSSKPTELRWKWVEDFCWRNGCLRSQTQCNDKWDNLMRDFKKIREYQRKVFDIQKEDTLSYWKLDKTQRKANNLPSNMLSQIFDALVDAIDKKGQRQQQQQLHHLMVVAGSGGGGGPSSSGVADQPTTTAIQPPLLPAPPLLPTAQTPPLHSALPLNQPLPAVDSDTTSHEQYSDSSSKRRRRGEGTSGGGGGGGGGSNSNSNEVGSAISKSASIIAEAIQASEEKEERRHRELVSLQQRRLQIEESKGETNRQGINGLVDAVNKLANSILALAAGNQNQAASD